MLQKGMALHPTGMWKCIQEAPAVASSCLKGDAAAHAAIVGRETARREVKRAYLFGQGTSHFAAIASAFAMNELAGIDSDVYSAFELLNYRLGGALDKVAALAFSHSGRTKATYEAAMLARRGGALTAAFTDYAQSPLTKACEYLVEGAGREPVGPKTRSFVNAVMLGYQVAAAVRNDAAALAELEAVGPAAQEILKLEPEIKDLAGKMTRCNKAFVVAGGANFAAAREISLKFRECTPMASEGMEVEDALHGPIRSLDRNTMVIGLSTEGQSYDKVAGLLKAASILGCPTVSVTNVPHNIDNVATLKVPFTGIRELFTVPLLVLPGYMLVYYSTLARGVNPDAPKKGDAAYTKAMASFPKVAY